MVVGNEDMHRDNARLFTFVIRAPRVIDSMVYLGSLVWCLCYEASYCCVYG